MNLSETLVIYLACGAPFGVEYLQRPTDRSFVFVAFGVFLRFILWPVAAVRMLYRLLVHSSELLLELPDAGEQRLALIRSKFEAIIHSEQGSPRVFEFRDTFMRYTGLARSDSRTAGNGIAEIFEATDHNDVTLASACLNRKNAARLERHREQSRREFLQLISNISTNGDSLSQILQLSMKTADEVGDRELAERLRLSYGIAAEYDSTGFRSDPTGELWSTGPQHHSIAN